jgi:hypothetical protein
VDGKPANVTSNELDFTCVHTGPNRKFDIAHGTGHCCGTTHGPGGTVEHGEKAIPRRCHLPASEAVQLVT